MRLRRFFDPVPRLTRGIDVSFASATRGGPDYLFGSICLRRVASADDTSADLRSLRFRFDDFLVRMCCLFARRRTILPVPVFLKRFAAPRCDFILGMRSDSLLAALLGDGLGLRGGFLLLAALLRDGLGL